MHRKLRRKPLRHLVVDVPTHVEPALRLVFELFERLRLDRINGNALAGREDANDAVARHRTALRSEAHRQIGIDAADGDCAAFCFRRQLELHRPAKCQAEPAAFGLRRDRSNALVLVVGIHGADHVGCLHLAATDRRHHVIDRCAGQPRQGAFELFVRIFDLGALAEPFDDTPPEPGILMAHRHAGGAANGVARLAGDDDRLPGGGRRGLRF